MGKKRNLKMWLVMAVFLVGMAPVIAAGGTIYVDADASAGGNGTIWGTAYKYLQDVPGVAVADDGIWELQVSATDFLLNASSTASGPFAVIHDVNILVEVNTTTPLPQALLAHTAVISDGRIYVAGGISDTGGIYGNGGFVNNVYYCAQINPDGTLGEWQAATSFPEFLGLGMHSSVAHGNAIYVLGGNNLFGPRNAAYYALVNPDGSLTEWQQTTLLPAKLMAHGTALHEDKIYVLGGFVWGQGITDQVFQAQILPDNTIGNWNTLAPFPKKIFGHKVIVMGNMLFVIGGTEGGALYLNGNPNPNVLQNVYSAAINADGSLEDWVEQPSLPTGLTFMSTVASNANIYVAGGFDGTGVTNAVYFAPVGENGSLGEWESLSILPQSLLTTASVAHNGFVYVLGGGSAYIDTPQTSVYYIDIRPPIIYVDADAAGPTHDGSSWEDAYTYLQDGLADANVSGNDIWVADGTYKPDANTANPTGTGLRTDTFQLINGVAIYGGFAGGESTLDERDWQTNETILSGDIGILDDDMDNSYHVVTGSGTDATAVLDGFTITAGNANTGSDLHRDGGGMYNESGSPTVTNCIISGNSAGYMGGGMYNGFSGPTVTNCTFSGNSATNGGGMNNGGGSPTVTNCTFIGNSANNYGGGMYNEHSSPTVTNCTFNGNLANYGGGIYNWYSGPSLTNCILWGNVAPSGSQIYNYGTSSPTISYSNVQGAWSGTGNIDADPLFVKGRYHEFYLSHTATGQPVTSPCVDAGSDTAANLGLDELTTRVDSEYDTGTVDMGYHTPSTIWICSIVRSGSDITIEWKARAGFSYVVEWSTDMDFATYTEVPVGTTYTWTDVGGALEPQRYYRVREQ